MAADDGVCCCGSYCGTLSDGNVLSRRLRICFDQISWRHYASYVYGAYCVCSFYDSSFSFVICCYQVWSSATFASYVCVSCCLARNDDVVWPSQLILPTRRRQSSHRAWLNHSQIHLRYRAYPYLGMILSSATKPITTLVVIVINASI